MAGVEPWQFVSSTTAFLGLNPHGGKAENRRIDVALEDDARNCDQKGHHDGSRKSEMQHRRHDASCPPAIELAERSRLTLSWHSTLARRSGEKPRAWKDTKLRKRAGLGR